MKTDRALLDRLDKFAIALLDKATDQSTPSDGEAASPPVELSEQLKALDSVVKYLAFREKIDDPEGEESGLASAIKQLSRTPARGTRREPSSRRPVGPGADTIPARDRFGPESESRLADRTPDA